MLGYDLLIVKSASVLCREGWLKCTFADSAPPIYEEHEDEGD